MASPPSQSDLDTQVGGDSPAPATPVARPLIRGDVVGRYVVLDKLGVGGMGEVYAAYDPELDRKIAVKLLLPGLGGSQASLGPGRLVREAQAMAKLHHPNVVAVHDVGAHEGRVFVAMEFVDAGTLADWMAEGRDGHGSPHAWDVVLARYVEAGKGLAAAHAAGLIHRDFKPANVLLGSDGAVRVADFGLARRAARDEASPDPDSPASEPRRPESAIETVDATLPAEDHPIAALSKSARASDSLSLRMTMTGATLGTPAYMAPEQYRGTEVDARADQFSFCVALWETLYGERPFTGDNLHALMFAIARGNFKEPPSNTEVPARIRRALTRGLANEPAQRWPDMAALLVELRWDPDLRRRRIGLAGVTAVLVLAIGYGIASETEPPPHPDPPCTGAAEALGDALSPERRSALVDQFAGLEHEWAHDLGLRLLPRLDTWALEWQAGWTDACEDTHVRQEQSEDLLDRRMLCLDRQRRNFVSLIDTLSTTDETLARKADTLLDELGTVAPCSDREALMRITPMPDDPAEVEAILRADAAIAEALGLYLAGRYAEARTALESQRESVTALAYDPLSAAFEQMSGRLSMNLDDPIGGEQALERAFVLALRSGDDRRGWKIARSLAVEMNDSDRAKEALRWLDIGEALIERGGGDDYARGGYAVARSQALASAGDYPAAEAAAQSAYEMLTRVRPDSAVVGDALYLLGIASYRAGRYTETVERLERARAAWASDIGPLHPRTGAALSVLGVTARATGDYAKAQQYFEQGLAIDVATYGADHIQTTDRMMNLSIALSDQGKQAEAIALNERVLVIRRNQPEPSNVSVGRTLVNLAQMQRKASRSESSLDRAMLDEANANVIEGETLIRNALGNDHPDLATVVHIRALIDLDRGALAEAERGMLEAIRVAEAKYGADNPAMFELRTDAAKVALACGQIGEAERWLESSSPEPTDIDPQFIAERAFVRARTLEALGRHDEAKTAANAAKTAFTAVGEPAKRELAEVEAWLAKH